MASGSSHESVERCWRPTAGREVLESRARQLTWVRGFFAQRGVLEVETPVLGQCGVTDVNIDSVGAQALPVAGQTVGGGWLQTSPEYHMKRLLAAGCGSIYQISRVFRSGERGARHNPEFSLVEWYRPGFDDRRLMAEVTELVCGWLDAGPAEILSYREAMLRYAGLDPFTTSLSALRHTCLAIIGEKAAAESLSRDECLDLLMGVRVEPELGHQSPVFICHYPASQAALARTSVVDGHEVAHRFELYIRGVELCNGFWELTDPAEQRRRFEQDNERRLAQGKTEMPVDERFLAALDAGLPDCAGVALGLDRLLMLKLGADDIRQVLAFPAERA